jgi:ABC-type multidrug transport system permease subunit
MTWLILWIVLSIPAALFIGAFVGLKDSDSTDWESDFDPNSTLHEQTFIG